MEPIFNKIIDLFLAIIILFLVPFFYFSHKSDTVIQQVIMNNSKDLIENVSTNGYLSKNMYENLLLNIDNCNVICEVELEHKKLSLEPEYRFKTVEEVKEEQDNKWEGDNYYTYIPIITSPEEVIDNEDNDDLAMNTETNESVLSKSNPGPKDPSHIHTDQCYLGTRHSHSSYGGSCYTYYDDRVWVEHNHISSCYHRHTGITGSCYTQEYCNGTNAVFNYSSSGNYGSTLCPTCGTEVDDGYVDYYKCGDCGASMGAIYYNLTTYHCGNKLRTGKGTTNSVSSRCSSSTRRLTCAISTTDPICGLTGRWEGSSGYNLTCGMIQGEYYRNSTKVSHSCHELVRTIIPTHPIQKVYLHEPLITTATITFLDGSTKVVVCSSNFIPNIIVNSRTVLLTYSQRLYDIVIDNTCNITVTVIPKTNTCSNGHTYKLKGDGSDPGCPYCKAWLLKLDVQHPASRELEIFKGTTLEQNGVILLATYMNGRKEYLTTGYVDNLDTNYVGTQTVSVSYKGFYNTIKVTTKRNLVKCMTCGKLYELMPDNTDPGCPFCQSLIPVFTGNVLRYYDKTYTRDILNLLYQNDIYYFNEGDYFTISIKNKKQSKGASLLGNFHKHSPIRTIHVIQGDKIRDVNSNK